MLVPFFGRLHGWFSLALSRRSSCGSAWNHADFLVFFLALNVEKRGEGEAL